MRGLRRLTVLPLLWGMVGGCTPIHRMVRVDDQLLGTRQVTDPPSSTTLVAIATPSGDGARVTVAERKLCARYEVRDVRRLRLHRRDPNRLVLALEWIFGLGAAAGGGYLTYVEGEPLVSDSVTPDQAKYASWGVAGVGGLLLLFAIIDTKLSTDWLEDQGRMSIPSRHRVTVACGEKPAPTVALALKAGGREVPLGTTADGGEIRLTWASLPPEVVALVEGDEPAKSVAIMARGEEIGTLPLEAARAARMEQAWAEAAEAGTSEAFADFRRRFPGERGGDGGKGLAESLERELDAAAAAALAARDVSRASEVLAWWRAQAPNSLRLAAREAELAEVERLGTADGLVGEADRLLAVAAAKPAVEVEPTGVAQSVGVEALVQATQAVERLERVAPADPRLAEVRRRVEAARTAKVAALLIDVKRLEKAKDGAAAMSAAAAAIRLAPGDAKVAAVAAGVRRREARRLAEEARAHERRGDQDAADEALAAAERVAPDDAEVRETRKRLEEQRVEQAAREEKARADAAAREEREKRKHAEEAARAEKARAEAAAREEKARKDELARAEKARGEAAAREEKARAEAAALEEKARKDEAARAEKARAEAAEAAAREEKARKDEVARAEKAGKDEAARAEKAGKDEAAREEKAHKDEAARTEKARKDEAARAEKARKDEAARAAKARADAARKEKARAEAAAREEKARADAAAREEKARVETAAREERERKKQAEDAARDEKTRADAAAREDKARAEAAARGEQEEKQRAREEREEDKQAAAKAREEESRAAAERERAKREQEQANRRRAEDEARAARTRGKDTARKTKNVARADAPAPPRETTTGATGTGAAGEVTRATTTTTAATETGTAGEVARATTTTTGTAGTTATGTIDTAPATEVAPGTPAVVAPVTTGARTSVPGDLSAEDQARLPEVLARVWTSATILSVTDLRRTLPGTWIAPWGNLTLTLADDGTAELASYGDQGQLIWRLGFTWRLDGTTVVAGVNGAWAIRGSARVTGGQLEWLGAAWTRPTAVLPAGSAPTDPAAPAEPQPAPSMR